MKKNWDMSYNRYNFNDMAIGERIRKEEFKIYDNERDEDYRDIINYFFDKEENDLM